MTNSFPRQEGRWRLTRKNVTRDISCHSRFIFLATALLSLQSQPEISQFIEEDSCMCMCGGKSSTDTIQFNVLLRWFLKANRESFFVLVKDFGRRIVVIDMRLMLEDAFFSEFWRIMCFESNEMFCNRSFRVMISY
ncbi:hypothetical protein CEXT_598621 [Caerostris extrusa]|uniref:Uncharacterized protein n=1 Tax=Caerostris extrusa TaxID=172846 RepID=A0AAV4XUK8_CAEEX|nr:hypothetical protein CEXT_598621 [Caerostris extrusa]